MRHARPVLAVATVVACLGMAGGTSAVAATSSLPTTKNPSKLTGSFTMSMNLALKPGFDALHASFNKLYPNIKITPNYLSVAGSSAYPTVIATQIAAGNPPDLMWMLPGQSQTYSAKNLGKNGNVITQNDQPWVKTMYKPIINDYKVGKNIYANEMALSTLANITYNKTIFAANKIKVPTTWSQFLRNCRLLASKGITPVSWGGGSPPVNTNNTWSLAYNNVMSKDPKWFEKRLNKQVTFAGTPGWRTSLQQVVDAQKNGCFKKGFEATQFADMATEFGGGKTAMMWTTAIPLGDILKAFPNFKFGMFPPPGVKASDTRLPITGQGGLGISVKATGTTRQAAQAFANYVYGEKQSRLLARVNRLISTPDAKAGKIPPAYQDLKPYFDQDKVMATVTFSVPNTTYSTAMGNAIQGLFTGQKTIDQALADIDRAFDAK